MTRTILVLLATALTTTTAATASAYSWVLSSGYDCNITCQDHGGGVSVSRSPESDGAVFGGRVNYVCGAWLQGASEFEWTPGQNWGTKVGSDASANQCCAGWKGTEMCSTTFECLCNN